MGKYFDYKVAMSYLGGLDSLFRKVAGSFLEEYTDFDLKVKKALVEDIVTIWANSVEIPARIGFSVDLHGEVDSYKLDLDRDFQISTEDIVKIDKHIVRIHVIKTQERKITSGFARAEVIKRVYGKPVKFNNFDYDLTKYIVKKTLSE